MDIERTRGFLMMTRLADKIALTGGGLTVQSISRPKVESIDFGDCLLPYNVSQPFQLALGCTFSTELCSFVAQALSAQAADKRYAFAGAVRCGLMRDPMSVSATEFFSEDAFLTSRLLRGYDPDRGLGFVFTDALGQGRYVSRTVDSRALYELYLYPLIKSGYAAAAIQLDAGYLNGEEVCNSPAWSYTYSEYINADAMVFSQFGSSLGVKGLMSCGAYQLGANADNKSEISSAVEQKQLDIGKLNRCVERTLATLLKTHDFYKDRAKTEIAQAVLPDLFIDSSVLLKNDGTLPIATKPTFFGNASDFEDGKEYEILPITHAETKAEALNVFLLTSGEAGLDESEKTIAAVSRHRPTVVFVCNSYALPIEKLASANAIVFCPIRPTITQVVEMLTESEPRGRLPFTWCKTRSAYPCNNKKHNQRGDFRYESLYNGYLLFNNFANDDVLYPFGHGLGYTEYQISKLKVKGVGTTLIAEFDIKNIGARDGVALCQAYATLLGQAVYGLSKRLVAFERVELEKGETKRVTMEADMSEFGVYNDKECEFVTVGGRYRLDVGLSSADIRASDEARISGKTGNIGVGLDAKTAPAYYSVGKNFAPTAPEIEKLLKVPFVKKIDYHRELDLPRAEFIKKPLKKAEKFVGNQTYELLKYKIETTPERFAPKK